MANFALKMKLIVWKNLIIRKRRWIFTTFEIVLPVLLYVILASLNSLIPNFEKRFINETTYYDFERLPKLEMVYFAPNNTYTSKIMDNVKFNDLPCLKCVYRGFKSEGSMIKYLAQQNEHDLLNLVTVVFNNVPDNKLPDKLNYRIRLQYFSSIVNKLFSILPPYEAYETYYYFTSKFISLQLAIDRAFINMTNPDIDFKITFQQMPDPPHWETSTMAVIFAEVMPISTVIAFMLVLVGIIQRVMEEKASGIKELMKMMGLKSWMLWFGWYIHSMFAIIISITAVTIILKVPFAEDSSPLIQHGDGFLLWIFLFLYCSSAVCFCFMVSTWLQRPMLGSSVGIVIWTLSMVPAMIIQDDDDATSLSFVRNFILLFPNSCLSFGFQTMYEFESNESGMQWNNLYTLPNHHHPYHSIGKILLMLIVDSIIFLILTWYIDNVNPGNYGIGRSFTFPFEKSYWCPRVELSSEASDVYIVSRDEVEPVPSDLQAGIKIRNLQKEFKKKKAVNGLNFDIYNNQITVLLGHNGAGKTTTMNIVTGMISPTSGSVLVDGYNVQTNMNKVRESLGLCPQHNVQFPDLTVVEHLMFFAMLKGMQKIEAKQESLDYLARLCMSAKANNKASTLSGGMRRRLSLGMALVGKTKTLMLDEPTSGMDPEARREIWDLLLSMRGERTILITTHYMEEADILGDRIAIMHSGQLMCYGTSLFLKKHYGTGYTLSILLAREMDINIITNAIIAHVPNAAVKNVSVGSIKFELPTNNTTALSELFLDLEQKKIELGIASFGVSITTMDDVFLKVGKIADEVDKEYNTNFDSTPETLLLNNHSTDEKTKNFNTGFNLIAQQFMALFVKRLQYTRRKLFICLIAILIPVALEFLTIFTNPRSGDSGKNVSQEINLGMYPNAQSFYSFDDGNEDLAKYYAGVVKHQNGLATKTDQVSDAIVEMAEKDLDQYYHTLITAAEFNLTHGKMALNAMYGRFPLHSPAISLNLISNALLKFYMKDTEDQYSITVVNNPLPQNFNDDSTEDGIIWIIMYPMGLTLFIAMMLAFHTAERLSGIKHLQIMYGVSRIMYWLSNYFFDVLVYLVVVAVSIIILVIFDESLSTPSALQAFALLMILFGLSAFPFSYFFHYRPTSGSVITFSIWAKIIFGTILPIIVVIWEENEEKKELREALTYVFMVCPHFAVSYGLHKLVERAADIHNWDSLTDTKKQSECESWSYKYVCCKPTSDDCNNFYNYFAGKQSISTSVLFLSLEIFFYFIIFLFVDYGLLGKYFDKFMDIFRKRSNINDNSNNHLDSDVIEENRRVAAQINESQRSTNQSGSDVLLVSNLRKWFANFQAVNGLNFGVKERECFGLLGINGAGKTTTFKMLTGEIYVSTGTAKILQYSLLQNKKTYLKQIGYCPQFDAFNFQLSTRQMLTFFAHLRGISQNEIENQVNKWLNNFDIMKYQNIQCAKLSGGNKRKLSTAIALIGDPPLIMLDEPTSGVDPVARRNLWSILDNLRKAGQAIVLTSHSMDECEALCDRLAIMVDGQMKCIGDIQYLKNKFGQGFTVMVKLRHITSIQTENSISFETQLINLKSSIEDKYACSLKDEHKGMVMYHITDSNIPLGEIFKFMEDLKQTKEIVEDFTVGDTSLEQVFLSFAKDKLAAKDKTSQRDTNAVSV